MKNADLRSYKKLCAEYYDLEPHRDEAQAMPFYMAYAHAAHGPILEPMCGTGRFLIPMLEAGFDIEGFDASAAMLDLLKKKYPAAPCWLEYVQNFKKEKHYTLIFIPYGSWGLITDRNDVKRGLVTLYNHLSPGGTFVFEIETIASTPPGLGIWHRGVHTRANGSYIALNTLPNYNQQTHIFTAQCRYELIEHHNITETEIECFQMYLYAFDEMDQLLTQTGFAHIRKYQDFNKTPATDIHAPLLIYECKK